MNPFYKKETRDYSDDELFSRIRNPKGLDKKSLTEIIDELEKRGHIEQVNWIENDLIQKNPIYSKFWHRFGAFLLDIVILGAFGYILGLFLGDTFAQMGGQSLLVGFFISQFYFGFGNSKIFNGQTIGKRVVKLQVVDSNMDTINISKSLIRALLYTVPYFFLNYKLAGWSEFSFLYLAKGIIFLTFLILIPIHLILNSSTRQAIHDLIMGTYVISLEAYPRQQLTKSKLFPTLMTCGIAIVILGLIIFMNLRNNVSTGIVHQLKPLKEQIDKIDDVGYSSLIRGTSSMKKLGGDSDTHKTEYMTLNIVLRDNLISNLNPNTIQDLDFVKEAVKIILKNYSDINSLEYIQINLIYGYNIGISKSSKSLGFTNTVGNWREKVK